MNPAPSAAHGEEGDGVMIEEQVTALPRQAAKPVLQRRTLGRFLPRQVTSSALGLLLLSAINGCFSSGAAKDKHAVFHGCDSSNVELEEVPSTGHTRYRTKGCGHEEVFSCIGAKCRSARILVARHYAADQKCKLEQVRTNESEPNQFAASGCAQERRYTCKEVPDDVLQCDPLK